MKGVGLYRTSEYSGFILVYRNTFESKVFVSDVTGSQKIQVSDSQVPLYIYKIYVDTVSSLDYLFLKLLCHIYIFFAFEWDQ